MFSYFKDVSITHNYLCDMFISNNYSYNTINASQPKLPQTITGKTHPQALIPATAHILAKSFPHPMSNTAEFFSLLLVTTEFLFPTTVLQLLLMKATTFIQGIPFASDVASRWSNMDCAVPLLQIGMSGNPVTALSLTSSKYLTTIASVLLVIFIRFDTPE